MMMSLRGENLMIRDSFRSSHFFPQGCFLEIRLAVWNVTDVLSTLEMRTFWTGHVFSYTKLFTVRRVFQTLRQTFIRFIPPVSLFHFLSTSFFVNSKFEIIRSSEFRVCTFVVSSSKRKKRETKKQSDIFERQEDSAIEGKGARINTCRWKWRSIESK